MKWRFPGQRAPAILDGTAQADIVRTLTLCRIMRRGDDVRQTQKRLIDPELSVAYRFNPPGIDAGSEARVLDYVIVQWPFLHDLATGQVNENGIVLHVSELGGADQAISGTGERRADQQNVGYLEEFIESIWCSRPVSRGPVLSQKAEIRIRKFDNVNSERTFPAFDFWSAIIDVPLVACHVFSWPWRCAEPHRHRLRPQEHNGQQSAGSGRRDAVGVAPA